MITTGFLCWALTSICVIILVFFTQLVEYEHRRWILFHFIFSNSLQLQSEENTNPVAMIFPSFIVCISFSVLSFYCECGIRVINQFSHFDETVCKCDWYTFPIELQRMLLIFMTSTQQPPLIHGFANAACTRESLKNVKIFFYNMFLFPSPRQWNMLITPIWITDNQRCFFILYDTSQNRQLKFIR